MDDERKHNSNPKALTHKDHLQQLQTNNMSISPMNNPDGTEKEKSIDWYAVDYFKRKKNVCHRETKGVDIINRPTYSQRM